MRSTDYSAPVRTDAGGHVSVDERYDRADISQAILESMSEAIFVVLPGDRTILLTNPAGEDLFGVEPGELVGRSTRVLHVSDEDYEEFGARSEPVLSAGRVFRCEHRFRRADGTVFEAEVTTTTIDPEDWSRGVVSIVRDISDLREAQRAQAELLEALAERIKELRAIHGTATILGDHDADLREVLRHVAELLPAGWQYPEATVVRIRYGEIEASSQGYRDTEWALSAEFRGRRGDVGTLTVCYLEEFPEAHDGPFLEEEIELVRSLAYLIESHIRAREQRELAERQRDRFRHLFRTGPVAMALSMAEEGRLIDVNDRWVELSGFPREELIGRTAQELGLWAEPQDREALRREVSRSGMVLDVPVKYNRRGAEPRVGVVSVQETEMEEGTMWFSTLLDRTDEARMEEERERLAEQKEALRRLGAIGELAGGIAHDFNNLLLPILINVELALPGTVGEERARLEEVREAAVRGRDLTRKLLAFGRQTEAQRTRVDLGELVRSSEALLRRLTPESITIETEISARAEPVAADSTLLEQVLLNLVVNAANAISGTGRIVLRVFTRPVDESRAAELQRTGPDFDEVLPAEYTYLEVEDDGCGIAPEIRGRIFEPFFTTREEAAGTGLGLASVLGMVKQHDGHIILESEVGVGTRFAIGLPLMPAGRGHGPPAVELDFDRGVGQGRRVLVVEDDDAVRRVTVRALQAFGFEVDASGDPREALGAIDEGLEVDLVVSDMVMPGMTGLELADALGERRPDLPVLFVSGYSGEVLANHGVDRDTVRILEKPFAPEVLARAAVESLSRSGARR